MMRRAIWIAVYVAMAIVWLHVLAGCGMNGLFADSTGHSITGASVNLSDSFKDQKASPVRQDKGTTIKVTSPAAVPVANPTTHPAPVAIEQPVVIGVGDKTVTAPPGSTVEMHVSDATESVPEVVQHDRMAIAQGASMRAKEQTQGNFDASAPVASLSATKGQGGGAKGSGGAVGADWSSLIPAASKLAYAIGITGLVLIVVAIALWYFNKTNIKTPLIVAALGVLLIGFAVVVDEYPWALLLVLFVAAILWALWWYSKQDSTVLSELVWGVETASPTTQSEIKAKMKDSPKSATIKRVVTQVKEG
jgi:hypothetical protein